MLRVELQEPDPEKLDVAEEDSVSEKLPDCVPVSLLEKLGLDETDIDLLRLALSVAVKEELGLELILQVKLQLNDRVREPE